MANPLFPYPSFLRGFTTSPAATTLPNLTHIPLSAPPPALGIHKLSSRTTHRLVRPPPSSSSSPGPADPEEAWEATYPAHSLNPTAPLPGGFGFYLAGPPGLLHGARDAVWAYRVMFERGWAWAKGGKLPGIFGGAGDRAYGCSGGRQDTRCQCFDVRLMWRPQGAGELYTYLPPTQHNTDALLAVPPFSRVNNDYGVSVGRGAFSLSSTGTEGDVGSEGEVEVEGGRWITVALRGRLNERGKEDGLLELWVDGASVIRIDHLALVSLPTSASTTPEEEPRIGGMHFQTFFGGHTPEWASPKAQRAWFADVSCAVLE